MVCPVAGMVYSNLLYKRYKRYKRYTNYIPLPEKKQPWNSHRETGAGNHRKATRRQRLNPNTTEAPPAEVFPQLSPPPLKAYSVRGGTPLETPPLRTVHRIPRTRPSP